MSLIEVNWSPDKNQLRSFGLFALIAVVVISPLLYFIKGVSVYWVGIVFGAGLIVFLSSRFCLKITKALYLILITVTMPIGFAVSFMLLAIFYFLLLTPLGLLFRLMGRDPLQRKSNPKAKSYWVAHRPPERLDRYFRQF